MAAAKLVSVCRIGGDASELFEPLKQFSNTALSPLLRPGVAVDLDEGAIDERVFEGRIAGQCLEESSNTPFSAQRRNRFHALDHFRQIAPGRNRCARSTRRLHEATIVLARSPRIDLLARKKRGDPSPVGVTRQPCDSRLNAVFQP
jgi:hypothetical protein